MAKQYYTKLGQWSKSGIALRKEIEEVLEPFIIKKLKEGVPPQVLRDFLNTTSGFLVSFQNLKTNVCVRRKK